MPLVKGGNGVADPTLSLFSRMHDDEGEQLWMRLALSAGQHAPFR